MDLSTVARLFIMMGIILILVGLAFLVAGKIPFLGKLPGDIAVQRKTWSLYIPITTCIIISIILTLIMWLFGRR
jgi:heme/copper-type cytochrome/quinol oxidase subunit 2